MINLTCQTEFVGLDPNFKIIPYGYIDKTICGCGLTSVALENTENVVIAVPTIYLALNKQAQYPMIRYPYNVLAVWGDTKSIDIENYVNSVPFIKIMCTYDSLPKVSHLLTKCRLIIDESNELLSKTKLKPTVINRVFEIAKNFKDSVSFISATPTDLKYMPKWISELNQVKIDFVNKRKALPILFERTYPFKSLKDEILIPLKENSVTVAGKTFSKVIVFINSVSKIADVVKSSGLNKSECGIICGDSTRNDVKIIGINRYLNGPLPKYLFLTSTGFSGIDLDDKDAMTIVVSNTSKNWQMIDMLTDLKQAVSRQRNKENPNYGSYIYIYNQSIFNKTESELLDIIGSIYISIQKGIQLWELAKREDLREGFSESEDFKAYTIKVDDSYVINEQAFNADKYFILEIRDQYTKGFDIQGSLDGSIKEDLCVIPKNVTYIDMVNYFNENHVKGIVDWSYYSTRTDWASIIESSYKLYGKTWRDYTYACKMIDAYGDDWETFKLEVSRCFSVGSRYTRKETKEILQKIYDKRGMKRKAKHTDLMEIMTIKEFGINGERMIEILKK